MCSPPDIKPCISAASAVHTSTKVVSDIKPSLPTVTKDNHSIDFTNEVNSIRKERERLEEKHQLHKSVLDLREEMLKVKEENRRLREGRGIFRTGSGLTDIKPDISKSVCGGSRKDTSHEHARVDVEGDDDDIVFVSETKSGSTRRIVDVKPGQSRR